ncbi:sensor domain-containing diguanylate cyclase [Vibrio sonorensis]|uniref:sensor domain-containing diguanylate cyclase n=1 Tax=Vibrio sonorensis TaxID=1004316 RepID=UPI0008DA8BC2|nr:diguanylate cyclase [Vibrio sonorensis]
MAPISDSEKIIRSLYQITNDYQKGFDIQVSQLILMGLERFNLDIGILSRIEGSKYTVLNCVVPEGVELNVGDVFDYDSTYCEITCSSFGPVAIENMGKDDKYASHPAYKAFGLESYIGIPIFVDDEVYGTLNFSSATAYPREFHRKDVDVMKLMASWIEVELIRRKQEKELQHLNEQLKFQAFNDSLTQLPNRRCLFKTMHKEIERIKHHGGQGTIAVIDIDHFKQVNDDFGHQVGDDVLRETAQVLKAQLSDNEFLARFGGEEFVVWLPEGDLAQRQNKLELLRKSVKSIDVTGRPLTISIGSCQFSLKSLSEDACRKSTLDKMISLADECLYEAKESGRDRVVDREFTK